jgi:hypothetical protein
MIGTQMNADFQDSIETKNICRRYSSFRLAPFTLSLPKGPPLRYPCFDRPCYERLILEPSNNYEPISGGDCLCEEYSRG